MIFQYRYGLVARITVPIHVMIRIPEVKPVILIAPFSRDARAIHANPFHDCAELSRIIASSCIERGLSSSSKRRLFAYFVIDVENNNIVIQYVAYINRRRKC